VKLHRKYSATLHSNLHLVWYMYLPTYSVSWILLQTYYLSTVIPFRTLTGTIIFMKIRCWTSVFKIKQEVFPPSHLNPYLGSLLVLYFLHLPTFWLPSDWLIYRFEMLQPVEFLHYEINSSNICFPAPFPLRLTVRTSFQWFVRNKSWNNLTQYLQTTDSTNSQAEQHPNRNT